MAATNWEVGEDRTQINPMWFPQYVTKTLITVRYNLMKMIDAEQPRPADVDPEVWATLFARRETP